MLKLNLNKQKMKFKKIDNNKTINEKMMKG